MSQVASGDSQAILVLKAELLRLAQMVDQGSEKDTIMAKIADILDALATNN